MARKPNFRANVHFTLVEDYDQAMLIFLRVAVKSVGIWTGQARGVYLAMAREMVKHATDKTRYQFKIIIDQLSNMTIHSKNDKYYGTGEAMTKAVVSVKNKKVKLYLYTRVPYFGRNENTDTPHPSTPWNSVGNGLAAMRTYIASMDHTKLIKDKLAEMFGQGNIDIGELNV